MPRRGPKPLTPRTARPRPPSAAPAWDPPAHLTGEAEAAWRHVVGLLASAGNLERTDPTLVEAYAINVALLRQAQAEVTTKGAFVPGRFGTVENPALPTINSATMRVKAIINDLGLCPASSKFAATNASSNPSTASKWDGLLGVVS